MTQQQTPTHYMTPQAIRTINKVGFAIMAELREQRRQRIEDEELDRHNPTRQHAQREAFEESKPFDIF